MSFELPEDISEDDETLLHSILSAMSSLDLCIAYKIVVPPLQPNIFLIKGQLPMDGFEVDMDQMHFIMSASPLRIEKIAVVKNADHPELIIRLVNSKQRVMLKETSTFYVSTRKRKLERIQ
jgi:hypothetical protein